MTFCEGPGGYHQMDVMGQALDIGREAMLRLGTHEAELSAREAANTIDQICDVASTFAAVAKGMFPGQITQDTLRVIQGRINENIERLR